MALSFLVNLYIWVALICRQLGPKLWSLFCSFIYNLSPLLKEMSVLKSLKEEINCKRGGKQILEKKTMYISFFIRRSNNKLNKLFKKFYDRYFIYLFYSFFQNYPILVTETYIYIFMCVPYGLFLRDGRFLRSTVCISS